VRRSIRFRIAALATVASAILLTTVSVTMAAVLRWQLTDNLDEGISQRADTIAAVVATDLPRDIPGDEDLLIQVVADDGTVLASSSNLAGLSPITSLRPGVRTITDVPRRPEVFRLLVRRIVVDGRDVVLIVGGNNDDVTDPVAILTRILTATVPIVVAVLGGLTWWLAGRTLRPVERMRREMSTISATNVSGRLAEPGTGDEIDRLARTMNQTLDRLEATIERQRRFVADASHELRSPLTRIRSELEIDLAGGSPANPDSTERSVLAEAVNLHHLVEDLLQLARSDDHLEAGSFQPVDLDDIVLREGRRLAERGRVRVDLAGVSAGHVDGDPRQLTRAVRNLFDNAERHAGSAVVVTLGELDDRLRFTVSDDGDGIPEESRELVFERFSRLDDARSRDAGGTGLGLAIVRDIVGRHGGTIHLEDSPRTRFVVDLPTLR
jgi:signal transduction histidine kinase